ncbi:hypothetical protein [Nocardia amamiensis]|uniref:hypothetical protein n=1 Tax=Nocardia amamiensis TaxID=404578 RepID=UPI000829A1CB|nr:hypothetical protein [Nocardia amamiensis]
MKDTSNETTESTSAAGGAGWRNNRTTLVLAAGFLGFVVIASAGILGYRALGGHDDDAQPQSRPSASAAPTTTAPNAPGGFGPPSADMLGRPVAHPNNAAGQALPQKPVSRDDYRCDTPPNCPAPAAPESVMWQEVKPWVLPFSTSDGPARVEGPLAEGYTRTPQGAALAAWQIVWRAASSREVFDAVMAHQIVGTPEDLAQMRATKQWDYSGTSALALRPSGFRITGWQGDFAAIQYAVPAHSPGVWNVVPIEVVWQDGDWRMRAPHTPAAKLTVVSLSGWTTW